MKTITEPKDLKEEIVKEQSKGKQVIEYKAFNLNAISLLIAYELTGIEIRDTQEVIKNGYHVWINRDGKDIKEMEILKNSKELLVLFNLEDFITLSNDNLIIRIDKYPKKKSKKRMFKNDKKIAKKIANNLIGVGKK